MVHDAQAQAFAFRQLEREARSVVPHAQNNFLFAGLQADGDLSGFSVFQRIPDGLLRDPIKVNLRGAVMNGNRGLTSKQAINPEQFLGAQGQVP